MPAVNEYLLQVERANTTIGAMVLWLGQRVETIEVRHGIVAALRLRQMLADQVVMALQLDLPEPITVAERDRRLAEQRSERIPMAEAAWLLVDHDLDEDELDRAHARQEARIREAGKRGEFAIERGKVRLGDLMDWAGREVTVLPEWGFEVYVLPDGSDEYIARVNRLRERLFGAVASARVPSVEDASDRKDMIATMVDAIASGLGECWGILLAIEAAAAMVATTFDGEAVVDAETMLQLDEVRQGILRNVDRLANDAIEVELLPEPDADFLSTIQRRVEG